MVACKGVEGSLAGPGLRTPNPDWRPRAPRLRPDRLRAQDSGLWTQDSELRLRPPGLTFCRCGCKIRSVEERIGFERSEYAPEAKRKASRGECEPGANRARNGSWSRGPKGDVGHRVGAAGVSTVSRSGVSAGCTSPYMSSGRRTPPMWVVPRTCKLHLRPSEGRGFFVCPATARSKKMVQGTVAPMPKMGARGSVTPSLAEVETWLERFMEGGKEFLRGPKGA